MAKCECGFYFERLKKNKKGNTVVSKECEACRAKRDYEKKSYEKSENVKDDTTKKTGKKLTLEKEQTTTLKSKENGTGNNTIERRQENEKPPIEKKTKKKSESTTGAIMQETNQTKNTKSSNEGNSEIQQLDSTKPSVVLRREQLGLVNSLNDMSEHLIGLGKSLAKPRLDEEGEVIQMAQTHNVDTAIKCFQEARSTMKVKLEALRFGKDILNEER